MVQQEDSVSDKRWQNSPGSAARFLPGISLEKRPLSNSIISTSSSDGDTDVLPRVHLVYVEAEDELE